MIPPFYNIVTDCVDRHAADSERTGRTAARFFSLSDEGIFSEGPALDFARAAHLIDRTALTLVALGGRPGDRLVLCLPNGPDFMLLFLGAIKAGMIPVPISNALKAPEIEFVLKDSGAKLAAFERDDKGIAWARFAGTTFFMAPDDPAQSAFLQKFQEQPDGAFAVMPTRATDPAYWIYTSGTTGTPKAVIHAHQSIPAHDARVFLWQDAHAGDVVFNTSALNWSYGLTCGFLDLWRHAVQTVIFKGPPVAKALIEVITHGQVTIFMSVPGLYRRLVDFMEQQRVNPFAKVRVCLSAGEKLPEEVCERFKKLTGLTIREGLGMTEHSVYLVQPLDEEIVPGSCGRPLPGTKVEILRDDLTPVAPDEEGFLASHRSDAGFMKGYFNRPEEEARQFRGEWFFSGDVARKDSQGNYFFLARDDDIIKAGGFKISPLEVEVVLNAHPAVAESAVVSREIEAGKNIVAAIVVVKEGCQPDEELTKGLKAHAALQLADYKVPREIIFIAALPRTVTGKIKRSELKSV